MDDEVGSEPASQPTTSEHNMYLSSSIFGIQPVTTPPPDKRPQNASDTSFVMKGIRVRRVLFPPDYDWIRGNRSNKGEQFVFQNGVGPTYVGYLTSPDILHEYDVKCILDRSRSNKYHNQTYHIIQVMAVRLDPFSARALSAISEHIFGSMEHTPEIDAAFKLPILVPSSVIGVVVQAIGATEWYKTLENEMRQVFREWYSIVLCPPYSKSYVATLAMDIVCVLIRLLTRDPCKLYYLCLRDLPIFDDEISSDKVALMHRIGVICSPEVALGIDEIPAPTLRDTGRTYMTLETYNNTVALSHRREMLKTKMVKYVSEGNPQETRVYVISDYAREMDLIQTIRDIITK